MNPNPQRKDGRHESPAQSGSHGRFRIEVPGVVAGDTPFSFFVGLHQPADAAHFDRCCISIHRLRSRLKPLRCPSVMVDSGAFTILAKHGCYPESVWVYALQLYRLHTLGIVKIAIACAQDYMCEPKMLERTGLTIADHQRLTIERYDALVAALTLLFDGPCPFPVMPVLQGFSVDEYLSHIHQYGARLTPGMWVGVGSVCKRQGDAAVIEELLTAIKGARPDLRLHGFRCEIHIPPQRRRSRVASFRRQHGLVFRGPIRGSKPERLARSQGVRAGHHVPDPLGSTRARRLGAR